MPIVQITWFKGDNEKSGAHIHFFVDELDKDQNEPRGGSFGYRCRFLGISQKAMRELINRHVLGHTVVFYPKSSWQKDGCINQSKEFKCRRKSTLEAVVGSAAIRCCDRSACKRRAANLAKIALRTMG